MKRKKNTPYCVVCRTRSTRAGLTTSEGVHICISCAENLYRAMEQFHTEHLDKCACHMCRTGAAAMADEIIW